MKLRLALAIPLFAALAGCGSEDSPVDHLPAVDPGAGIVTASYSGRALYRGTKAPVSDITVQVTGAKDDGSPTDDVFGTTHADARGRFTVDLDRAARPEAWHSWPPQCEESRGYQRRPARGGVRDKKT